ncbi:AraC family transcriptional regulator [Amycolatopsis sp. cmx-4-61]|uniref:AraC family transcriptional regulator n=1 Tax=Amycolatopsis sp. cmx-4-61 TaxID=2790937 RepID=UPI0039789C6E
MSKLSGVDVLADILTAMRVGRPVAALTEVHAPWGLRFDQVLGAAFHVVLQGSCQLVPLPGTAFAEVQLGPGDVVLLGGGTPHAIVSAPDAPRTPFAPVRDRPGGSFGRFTLPGSGARSTIVCGAYKLMRHRPHPLLRDLPEVLHLPAAPGRNPNLRAMVDLLGAELHEAPPGAAAVAPALVDALLVYLIRAWMSGSENSTTSWSAALSDPEISPVLAAMHADPRRAWTVQQLAAVAGLSRAAFARRFTSVVGEPPLTYFTRWRMTIAAQLLRTTDHTLARVADAVGYGSPFAFAKAFTREYATTPGSYRAEPGG